MKKRIYLSITAGLLLLLGGCTKADVLYCDQDTPCTDSLRPYCDLSGEFSASSGVGHTCIADPSTSPEVDAGFAPDATTSSCMGSEQCGSGAPICVAQECELCTAEGAFADTGCASKDASKPICANDGLCYECQSSAHCQEQSRPVCDTQTGICGGCEASDECSSGACEVETGRCVAESNIIYADSVNGVDSAFCGGGTGTAACRSFAANLGALSKLQGSRRYVVLAPGNYPEVVTVSGLDFEVIGNGAEFYPPTFMTTATFAILESSKVILHDLVIKNANGMVGGSGIWCANSSIEFRDVTLRDNDEAGINASNCNLDFSNSSILNNGRSGLTAIGGNILITDSMVRDNGYQGVQTGGASVEILRTQVLRNQAGGLHLGNTDFLIENTIIAKNGNKTMNPGTFAGGIVVSNGVGVSPQVIRHSTIADNEGPVILGAVGIDCGLGGSPVRCVSNIVVNNQKPNGNSEVGGNCDVTYSSVAGITSGLGNIAVAPTFVSAGNADYHLAQGSAGIDIAEPSSPTSDDIDGQSRPMGNGFDMGAHERQQ